MAELNVIKTNKKLPAVKVAPKKVLSFTDMDERESFETAKELVDSLHAISTVDGENLDLNIDGKAFGFTISGMPHCCGISEFGNLTASLDLNVNKSADVIDCLIESSKGHTVIVNTNGDSQSRRWDSILTKSKYFKVVKKFVNSNSRNTITVWMSNND